MKIFVIYTNTWYDVLLWYMFFSHVPRTKTPNKTCFLLLIFSLANAKNKKKKISPRLKKIIIINRWINQQTKAQNTWHTYINKIKQKKMKQRKDKKRTQTYIPDSSQPIPFHAPLTKAQLRVRKRESYRRLQDLFEVRGRGLARRAAKWKG